MEYCRQAVEKKIISINAICKLFSISKPSFYNTKDKLISFEKAHRHLKKIFIKVVNSNSGYGIRRIYHELNDNQGVGIGKDKVAKLCRIWGLFLNRRIRKAKPNFIQKTLILLKDKANKLKGLKLTRPLQAISSDITELVYKNGKAYLCTHKDVFSEGIYGHTISEVQDENLVIESFLRSEKFISRLIGRSKKLKQMIKKIIYHQDRGSQYTGYRYVELVIQYGKLSYSAPGTPTDNPGQESFHGRFKVELQTEISELETYQEVVKFVNRKIKYYNYKRLHSAIGYKAPIPYTKTLLKAIMKTGRSGKVK